MFFANGLTQASASVVSSGNLIKKVYFPRLIIPISTILSDLSIGPFYPALGAMMLWYGIHVTANAGWRSRF